MSSKTIKVEMSLPELPEGFEYTGEYRSPKKWENYLGHIPPNLDQWVYDAPCMAEYPIVRKCEVWRDANAKDVYEAISGKEILVRFADDKFRLVGGELRPAAWMPGAKVLAFRLQRPNNTTFIAGACEVQVS